MRIKKRLVALAAAGVILGGTAIATAAIPDSGGTIHSCYNSGLLPSFKIYDPGAGQSCGLGQTALTWSQTGLAAHFVTGDTDNLVTDSSGYVTDGHTEPLVASCGTNELILYGLLKVTGPGAAGIIGPPGIDKFTDNMTLDSISFPNGSDYTIGTYTGVNNANIAMTLYALCIPVPSIPS